MKLSRYDFLRSSLLIAGAVIGVVGCAADAGVSLPRGKRTLDVDDDDPESGSGNYGGSGNTQKSPSSKAGSNSTGDTSNGTGGYDDSGESGNTGNDDDDPGTGTGDPNGEAGQANTGSGGSGNSGNSNNEAGSGSSTNGESCNRVVSTIDYNHGHVLVVAAADVIAGKDRTYDITGDSSHPHQVRVTAADFADMLAGKTVVIASDGASHTHNVQLRCG